MHDRSSLVEMDENEHQSAATSYPALHSEDKWLPHNKDTHTQASSLAPALLPGQTVAPAAKKAKEGPGQKEQNSDPKLQRTGPCMVCCAIINFGSTDKIFAYAASACSFAGQGRAGHIQKYPPELEDFFNSPKYLVRLKEGARNNAAFVWERYDAGYYEP